MSDAPSTPRPDYPVARSPESASPPDRSAVDAPVVTYQISTRSIWQVIGAILLTLVGIILVLRARDLVGMLVISIFFSLALTPLVERIHRRHGWKRGAAVGVVYAAGAVFLIVMVVFLIPMIVNVAQRIGENWSTWMGSLNEWAEDTVGMSLGDITASVNAGEEAAGAAEAWSGEALGGFIGAFAQGIGLVFSAMTIALFTFYFTADHIRIQRAVLSWFSPKQQERLGWTWDQAIEQTGGYFYSRLLLMLINGLGFFFTMVLVGLDVLIALPLAIIAGFISEFIPAVGTYIGGAIPVLMVLAFEGFAQALIVLAYVLIYQQVENYWLSPKVSAQTMELNGGVAFGGALAGGAIAGPMGAFMALPVAALITSLFKHYRRPREIMYESVYAGSDQTDDDPDEVDPNAAAPGADDAS